MPVLRNPRHEIFAQALAKGVGTNEAFEAAGFKPNPGNARRLKMDEAIAKRIEAILSEREHIHSRAVERAIERTAVTIESLTDDLARIAMKAEGLNNGPGLNAARAAKMDIARLNGMIIERSEIGKPGDFSRMTEDELERFISERTRRISGGLAGTRSSHTASEAIEPSRRVN